MALHQQRSIISDASPWPQAHHSLATATWSPPEALQKSLEDDGRAEVRRSTEFHAQTSSAHDEELKKGGGRYLNYRPPHVLLCWTSNRRSKFSPKILQKITEMENVWTHVPTKFRVQINSVDEEIKKEKSAWGGRYFKYRPPPFYIELQITEPNIYQIFYKNLYI